MVRIEERFFLGRERLQRRLDVLVDRSRKIGFESKVGRTSLDRRVRQGLARDLRLFRSGDVDEIVREFSPSPVTGKTGPVPALLEKLKKCGPLGIQVVMR